MSKTLFYTTGDLATKRLTGGIKRFMELVRYGFATNKDVMLCSQTDVPKLQELGVKNHILMNKSKGGLIDKFLFPEISLLIANYRIVKQLKKQNFDNVVVFDVPPTIGLILMGFNNVTLMLRKDMIGYESVNTPHKGIKYYAKISVQWLCEAISLLKSKRIVTQCYYDRDQLVARHPFLKKCICKKTKIQINNVNPSWARKTEAVSSVDSIFRVCFIGDFSSIRKGHDLLLESAKFLLEEGCNMEFIVIGDGIQLDYYKNKYQNNRIRFTGRLKNATEELIKSTLLVVPSRADSCPNTVLEALYSGIPVIGSNAGGIPEILKNVDSLFELTVEGLSNKLRELYFNSDKLASLLEAENLRCKELEFNWAEKIFEIIEN